MKDHKTYTLTRAEIQIMNILWEMPDGGCVHDIIARYEDPKPAYTTIATFMKILLNKKFVEYRKVTGKTYFYYPLMHIQNHAPHLYILLIIHIPCYNL